MKKLNRKKVKSKKAVRRQASPAEKIDEVRATLAAKTISEAEVLPKGLVEIEIKDSAFKLLGMRNQSVIPPRDQRVAIASRLSKVGPLLPRYVKQILHEAKPRAAFDAAYGKGNGGTPTIGDAMMK